MPRKRSARIDYAALAEWIGTRAVTARELAAACGVPYPNVFGVIDTLSINYTLYAEKRGVYRMLKPVCRQP